MGSGRARNDGPEQHEGAHARTSSARRQGNRQERGTAGAGSGSIGRDGRVGKMDEKGRKREEKRRLVTVGEQVE